MGSFEELLTDAKDTVNASVRKSRLGSNILHLNRTDRSSVSHQSIEYLHRDHLGSVEAVTNESGSVVRAFGFDPFGERRHEDWNRQLSPSEIDSMADDARTSTTRGYTGHENLDRTGLVHMNGRIYDPQTGRFLSPDPVVQAPGYSQSWNRYSYVWNQPMTLIDPSGYEAVQLESHNNWGYFNTWNGGIIGFTNGDTAGIPIEGGYVVGTGNGPTQSDQNSQTQVAQTTAIRISSRFQTSDNLPLIAVPESGQTDDPISQTDERTRQSIGAGTLPGILTFYESSTSYRLGQPDEAFVTAALLAGAQDGHLTLDEANAWWQLGRGRTITVDLGRIDLSAISSSDFSSGVGSSQYFNLLDPKYLSSINDGLVFGNIRLTLGQNGTVTAADDVYDFDLHKPWRRNAIRNLEAAAGNFVAGYGGQPFVIRITGTGTLGR